MRPALLAKRLVRRSPLRASAMVVLLAGRRQANRFRRRFAVTSFHRLYQYMGNEGGTYADTWWLGVPIVKCPLDLWVYQEILFERRPDVVVECGTASGGSALFLAGMFDLIGSGRVVTVDVLEGTRPEHPRITYLTGSSTDPEIVARIQALVEPGESVMVILDSDHARDHVLRELALYSPLVSPGQYLIVEDTNLSGHPVLPELPPGPTEALERFLPSHPELRVDRSREKFLLTANPGGYLERVR